MTVYAFKQYHGGFNWGWWQQKLDARDSRIHRDNYEPCYDIGATDGTRHVFKFGNEWASKPGTEFYGKPFQHPNTIPHLNWHFWDNPEMPQFLWNRAHNPSASKDWIRWTPSGVFSTMQNTHTGDVKRINTLLQKLAGTKGITWETIVDPQPIAYHPTQRVLLCPVTAPNYTHYYNTSQQAWITTWTKWAERLGYSVDVRIKPPRTQRSQYELTEQLSAREYTATISQHSAAAIESLLAGTPAVVTHPTEHPCGPLATTPEQFRAGDLNLPTKEQAYDWYERLLSNIRHKREVVEHGI